LRVFYAGMSVLTPMPGADLYEEVKGQLIMNNYDYVDFLHTMLPTTLPLKDFYAEIIRFQAEAVPLRSRVAFLWKYALRDIPIIYSRWRRVGKQIVTMYKDYD
jgi:hypothetical protein